MRTVSASGSWRGAAGVPLCSAVISTLAPRRSSRAIASSAQLTSLMISTPRAGRGAAQPVPGQGVPVEDESSRAGHHATAFW
ncbi:hypothetical protein [Nesterenkonia pannonica]|uniref:hypothetical protein n=1 Tax=Nesterenkonia pannonica TaxID=1548602 RepID=UPI0021644948|nr:hypothetical protein [Nesterenkonia pannonica]